MDAICNICGVITDHGNWHAEYLYQIALAEHDADPIRDLRLCDDCARQYTDRHYDKIASPVVNGLLEFTNKGSSNAGRCLVDAVVRAFVKGHRYLQAETIGFIFKCLEKIAALDDATYTDGRNRWAYDAVRRAVKAFHNQEA